MQRALAITSMLVLTSCLPTIPDDTYVCMFGLDCPPQMDCVNGLCTSQIGSCEAQTCDDLRAQCGQIDNGCGSETLECGDCVEPYVCGAMYPNTCGCMPRTCGTGQCGMIGDGCGIEIDCGVCAAGQECLDGQCGCAPVVCGNRCGMILDGCGNPVQCAECAPGETCGAGGPNLCGVGTCDPPSCAPDQCGSITDPCGGPPIVCSLQCVAPEECNAVELNHCGCRPKTCAEMGFACGAAQDDCGNPLNCQACPNGNDTCTDNQCVCVPPVCAPKQCGILENPCGANVVCAMCPDGEVCRNGMCGCAPDGAEPNDTAMGAWPSPVTLSNGTTDRLESFHIHTDGNDDWYRWNVSTVAMLGATYQATLSLENLPPGADYHLEGYVLCALDTLNRGVITCGADDTPIVMDTRTIGCRSASAGDVNENVELSVMGCVPTLVRARVVPQTTSTCDPYALEVRFGVNTSDTDP